MNLQVPTSSDHVCDRQKGSRGCGGAQQLKWHASAPGFRAQGSISVILGLHRDKGKENGNYCLGLRAYGLGFRVPVSFS